MYNNLPIKFYGICYNQISLVIPMCAAEMSRMPSDFLTPQRIQILKR